jgi:hypothetical protein
MRRASQLLAALLAAPLLAACGGSGPPATRGADRPPRTVGTGEVERLLVGTQQRRSPRLRVGAAHCPARVTLANGTSFRCSVEIEGTRAPYVVTLREVDEARATGRFALAPAEPIIDVSKVVGLIRARLRPAARAARVDCGAARVRVVQVGAAIRCTVSLGGATQRIRALVKDLQGTVELRG